MSANCKRHGYAFTAFVVGHILVLMAGKAWAVSISQVPLFVSSTVKPNVMLQFDNSGSMASIIWHQDYDSNEDYEGPFGNDFVELGTDRRVRWNCGLFSCDELYLPGPSNTRYDGNYLNWLIARFGEGSDLRDGQIPSDTRLSVAKEVAARIVEDNEDIHFGLAKFNPPGYYGGNYDYGHGGSIVAACGADPDAVIDAIEDQSPEANTPLSETFYEVTRYFRGMSRHYGDGRGDYRSPIDYRCQRNFVITITDGLPTYDNPQIRNRQDHDLPGEGDSELPNWDGLGSDNDDPPYEPYSDGSGGSIADEGSTLYLDDLAKFGYDLDLKPEGTDVTGGSYEEDAYDPQRLETYTVGFTIDNQMLEDAAEYGNGRYFTANNLEQLTTALQGALSNIADKTSTAASLAATSTQASSSTRIFRATFNSGAWSGELRAFALGSDPVLDNAIWSATDGIPGHGDRNIFTVNGSGNGVRFSWNNLGGSAQDAIGDESVLAYIRGDDAETEENGGEYRDRDTVLGDIVNSTPAVVGDESFGYGILEGAAGASYSDFVSGKSSRGEVVLVGANDGMLHAFDVADGTERFAYVPRHVIGGLEALTRPDYSHRYFVDGSPAVADAYLDDDWRTVAVTTLGRGGRGAFALDVTSPGSFGIDDVLWEIDPDNVDASSGLSGTRPGRFIGQGMGDAAVVRLESGNWVALLGNGYNSQAGTAALLVLDLSSGTVLDVLDTGVGNDNGLAAPTAIDRNRDGSVDTAYAGDLKGNLWKFDLSSEDRARDASVAYNGEPLFTAVDDDGGRQSITARTDAIAHPQGGVMVVFGTGRYLSNGDTQSDDEQSVYGVWDVEGARASDGTSITDSRVSSIDELVEQTVQVSTMVGGQNVRVLSRNSIDYGVSRGWVFDLSREGERIVRDVSISDGKAIMVSTIPAPDPCSFGGDSSLIEINPITGTQFDRPVLDLNGDGAFDDGDGVSVDMDDGSEQVFPGIVDLNVGLATNPYILNTDDGNQEKLVTGSNLQTEQVGEAGFLRPGRASWLQLR